MPPSCDTPPSSLSSESSYSSSSASATEEGVAMEDGATEGVRVIEGRAGARAQWRRALLTFLRRAEFAPGHVDGTRRLEVRSPLEHLFNDRLFVDVVVQLACGRRTKSVGRGGGEFRRGGRSRRHPGEGHSVSIFIAADWRVEEQGRWRKFGGESTRHSPASGCPS